ncbi:glycoside hydrolase family 2 protein [Lacticaseibacillus jixianensis]|uniref:Glycoside hydrolase family 2 protein n=1 Tax=Lacticaseibacillus jixianensis TaxID=2486012 RepID=A0ABW4BAV6_9LACO|nr:sugar-binding domain-containing protein [Lacticaseibacillus jixianensis]
MLREEYPRPELVRNTDWQNLNGSWDFAFDDAKRGMIENWPRNGLPQSLKRSIEVPFAFQSSLSTIHINEQHDHVWYSREFRLAPVGADKQVLLHFGAVDYATKVFVNGAFVGEHSGGETPFCFDITEALNPETTSQSLCVYVEDRSTDETIPRGKQAWMKPQGSIWYTNTTGIWQTVWLEAVNRRRIQSVQFTSLFDQDSEQTEIALSDEAIGSKLHCKITFKNQVVAEDEMLVVTSSIKRAYDLIQNHILRTYTHDDGWTWTPEHPNLFTVEFTLTSADDSKKVLDHVTSYFGFREVTTENGMIYLNRRPYYQRLVLDQGYWPDGILTAPSDEAFVQDIKMAKAMGFNGCRKHQKLEDPRFLYWADKLGFLVWEEVASAPYFSKKMSTRLIQEYEDAVTRDYNHPSIIVWVPLNESWGVNKIHLSVQQQHFAETLYHLLHTLDTTRLVGSNDGWENTTADIVTLHNYLHGKSEDDPKYRRFKASMADQTGLLTQPDAAWAVMAKGYHYQGQPLILTEFGGVKTQPSDTGSADQYFNDADKAAFLKQLRMEMAAITASSALWGYCFTQLADVEQEVNGLLTADRRAKLPLEEYHQIFAIKPLSRPTVHSESPESDR